jgi:hypothetical protein
MNNMQVIKAAGYRTKRIDILAQKTIFGGTTNFAVILVNSNDEVLHFEDHVYTPIGRAAAFAELIRTGDILAPCFSFSLTLNF